jgi:hypothetical protein
VCVCVCVKQGCGFGLDPDPWARKVKKKMHFSLTF